MRKLILALTIISFLLTFQDITVHSSGSCKNTMQLTVNDVISKVNEIKTYHVLLNTRLYKLDISEIDQNFPKEFNQNNFMTVNSSVYGESGKKMRINTVLKSPDFKTEIDLLLIFDGTWLWIEQQLRTQEIERFISPQISAMKIRISEVSPDATKKPFSTIYGISGTGLFRYNDLPGTLKDILTTYKLVRVNKDISGNNKEIIFIGESDEIALGQVEIKNNAKTNDSSKELSHFINKSTKYCKIWVSKTQCLVNAFLLGASEKQPYIHTKIDYKIVNEILPEGIFLYKPPSGVEVRDITSNILQQRGKESLQN